VENLKKTGVHTHKHNNIIDDFADQRDKVSLDVVCACVVAVSISKYSPLSSSQNYEEPEYSDDELNVDIDHNEFDDEVGIGRWIIIKRCDVG
jgi:hypothetical protein